MIPSRRIWFPSTEEVFSHGTRLCFPVLSHGNLLGPHPRFVCEKPAFSQARTPPRPPLLKHLLCGKQECSSRVRDGCVSLLPVFHLPGQHSLRFCTRSMMVFYTAATKRAKLSRGCIGLGFGLSLGLPPRPALGFNLGLGFCLGSCPLRTHLQSLVMCRK